MKLLNFSLWVTEALLLATRAGCQYSGRSATLADTAHRLAASGSKCHEAAESRPCPGGTRLSLPLKGIFLEIKSGTGQSHVGSSFLASRAKLLNGSNAFTPKNNQSRPKKKTDIVGQRAVRRIFQIRSYPLHHASNGSCLSSQATNLGKPGNPGFYPEATFVTGD
jgi:hypothetical protein